MRKFLQACKKIFSSAWCIALMVTCVCALLVWFVVPLVAVAGTPLLQGVVSRLVVIVCLFLAWGFFVVFYYARKEKREAEEAAGDEEKQRARERRISVRQQVDQLRQGLKQALKTIRYSAKSSRYDLPWYLLMGTEGCGKTSLLSYSGLRFPISDNANQHVGKPLEPTRDCNWFFSNHAVLLDPSGRYIDSGLDEEQQLSSTESAVWKQFLRMIQRARRRRPLNGVLVCVSAEIFAGDATDELRDHRAKLLRLHLTELEKSLKVSMPIYLVITKSDLIPGFKAFFSQMPREERRQVLGATFEGASTDPDVLHKELDALVKRLNGQVISRVHQERDPLERGLLLGFPRELGKLQEQLQEFISVAFGASRYHAQGNLRGFYFTSARQGQNDLTEPYSRTERLLNTAPSAISPEGSPWSFFINRLFTDVIFPEANMGGLEKRYERRLIWGQRAACLAAVAVLAAAGGLWAASFSANAGKIQKMHEDIAAYKRIQEQTPISAETALLLPMLNRAYDLTTTFSPAADPVLERLGLYQGEKVEPPAKDAYIRTLRGAFLQHIERDLGAAVRQRLKGDPGELKEALKAYLMLYRHDKLERPFLERRILETWAERYTGMPDIQRNLQAHLTRLLDAMFGPMNLDQNLIADARKMLLKLPYPQVVYRMFLEEDAVKRLPAFSFAEVLGADNHFFFSSKRSTPGIFTKAGMENLFIGQGMALIRGIAAENWILGNANRDMTTAELLHLFREVQNLYLNDYAKAWEDMYRDVQVVRADSFAHLAEQLDGLASSVNILRLIRPIAENTIFKTVDKAPDQAALLAAIGRLGELEKAAEAARAQGKEPAENPVDQVQAQIEQSVLANAKKIVSPRFAPTTDLLTSDGQPGRLIEEINAHIAEVQSYISTIAMADDVPRAAWEAAAARMTQPSSALSRLVITSRRLPPAPKNWMTALTDGAWRLVLVAARDHIRGAYAPVGSFFNRNLANHYPFNPDSKTDVSMDDFTAFFKSGGLQDAFFKNMLQPFVDTSGTWRLRVVSGQSLPISENLIMQLQRGDRIRRRMFADGAGRPGFSCEIAPRVLDASLLRATLRYGSQIINYRHGPVFPTSIHWPPKGGDGVRLELEDVEGETTAWEAGNTWGLYRLVSEGNYRVDPKSNQTILGFLWKGKEVKYTLQAPGGASAFSTDVFNMSLPEGL